MEVEAESLALGEEELEVGEIVLVLVGELFDGEVLDCDCVCDWECGFSSCAWSSCGRYVMLWKSTLRPSTRLHTGQVLCSVHQ